VDVIYKLLKFHFVEVGVCLTAACGSNFILVYVRLYVGGGAFDTVLSNKIFVQLLTVIKGYKGCKFGIR